MQVNTEKEPPSTSERELFDRIEGRILRACSPGIRPGLSRMARLCSLLGNPERRFPALHVLGTNGKGSVCASLDAILCASGYRTARYTSPHLEHLGERLTFDGKILPATCWNSSLERTLEAVEGDPILSKDPPSVFEVLTAIAFLCIAEGNRDIAIIEAGMGGRLDATNLLKDVRATIFCALGLDHEDYLGKGIEAIAREKYSVLRPGAPVFALPAGQLPERFLFERAGKMASGLSILGKDAFFAILDTGLGGSVFELSIPGLMPIRLKTPLLGEHQVGNAALAALACLGLSRSWKGISKTTVRKGLENTRWPGRLERLPLVPPVVLDGAHNPQGCQVLSKAIVSLWPDSKPTFIMAAMKDKDLAGMLQALSTCGGELFCTEIPGLDRCETAERLALRAGAIPWPGTVRAFQDPFLAISEAMASAPLVICAGSLYFIGSIRKFLLEKLRQGENRR